MSEPVAFLSHFRVKAGMLDAYSELQRRVTKQLEVDKPRTLVFLVYLSHDGAQMTAMHVFADAEAMDLHVQGSDARSAAAYEFLEAIGWEVYGTPSDDALATLRRAAETTGGSLTIQPAFAAGFIRTGAR